MSSILHTQRPYLSLVNYMKLYETEFSTWRPITLKLKPSIFMKSNNPQNCLSTFGTAWPSFVFLSFYLIIRSDLHKLFSIHRMSRMSPMEYPIKARGSWNCSYVSKFIRKPFHLKWLLYSSYQSLISQIFIQSDFNTSLSYEVFTEV
jgi:hypothetical protein